MYVYDAIDQQLLKERVQQYRRQTQRFLKGELSEAEFPPLRLQNGLYVQRLAPMLRVCIPYGLLNSEQLRKLAHISRHYDKGFAHISTRQNIQYNWPKLDQVPDILADLADVQMHAIQTSGNCIRNVTTDQYAGVAKDELEDPRPWCEIVRQWATFHPEFAYLPRKFKIAICGSQSDRAATYLHDIGLEQVPAGDGETAFRVLVGGGLGRTPVIGTEINAHLPQQHLLSYLEAILRVYNQHGRRDNKYKARIKILVRALGADKFREMVDEEWAQLKDGPNTLTRVAIDRARASFTVPDYESLDPLAADTELQQQAQAEPAFANWLRRNVVPHRTAGYAIVNLSLKATGFAPGDISDTQMEAIADMADHWSLGEIRTSHQQNIVLGDVRKSDLFALWQKAVEFDLATANIGYLTDIICCPGGDYCALANAKSIPIAEAIQRRFDDVDFVYDLGQIDLNISGCMNACSHHHVGHIGILGVDKKGKEYYQVSLGGNADKDASLGKILGPAFEPDVVPDVIANILETFAQNRKNDEPFLDTYRRIGMQPFKERVYASAD